jgi:hypothetical protein
VRKIHFLSFSSMILKPPKMSSNKAWNIW